MVFPAWGSIRSLSKRAQRRGVGRDARLTNSGSGRGRRPCPWYGEGAARKEGAQGLKSPTGAAQELKSDDAETVSTAHSEVTGDLERQ